MESLDVVRIIRQETGDEYGSGAEGGLDFKEGDSGRGIFQLHEMGLTEEEAKRGAKTGQWSAHMDFRMQRQKPTKADYYEGGELFTPGNPSKRNKLLDYRDAEKIAMNFKVPRKEDREGKKGPFVVRGPLSWMGVGSRGPVLLSPGTAGAPVNSWARVERKASFSWRAGTQERHYKEFWFGFEGELKPLSGRWIFTYAPLTGGRRWLTMRPTEQRMDAEVEKGEKVKWTKQSPIQR